MYLYQNTFHYSLTFLSKYLRNIDDLKRLLFTLECCTLIKDVRETSTPATIDFYCTNRNVINTILDYCDICICKFKLVDKRSGNIIAEREVEQCKL